MSKLDRIAARARRPLAIFMTATLVFSSAPMLPIAEAALTVAQAAESNHASAGSWDDLSQQASITYDSKSESSVVAGTLSFGVSDIKSLVKGSSYWSEATSYTKGGSNVISQSVDAELATIMAEVEQKTTDENGNTLSYSDSVASDVTVTLSSVTPGSITASSPLTLTGDANGYTLSASSDLSEGASLSIPVTNISYTYSFSYSYTKTTTTTNESTGESEESSTTIDGSKSNQSGTLDLSSSPQTFTTGTVTASDYWDGVNDEVSGASTATVSGLTYGDAATSTTVLSTKSGLIGTVSNDNEDYFTVSDVSDVSGSYSVSVTPKKAFEYDSSTPKTFTISWVYPNGESAGSTTVTVEGIERKAVDLSGCVVELPFRLASSAKQANELKDEVNSYVAAQTTINGTAEVEGYLSAASLYGTDNYYSAESGTATLTSDDFMLELDTNVDTSNFDITDSPSVTVKQMETVSWADDNVQLTKTGLSDNNVITASNWGELASWTRGVPTASWSGHRLSSFSATSLPMSADGYAGSVSLGAGDGIHKDISLYAYDESDETISKVTGISYMLDRTAPVINGAQVSSSKSNSIAGIFFGLKSILVELNITDTIGNTADGQASESATSGLYRVDATYDDNESGRTDIDSGISGDASTGAYSFTIEGDADVDTEDIHVTATDYAGNVLNTDASDNRGIPIEYTKLVADASDPRVSVSFDNNDARNGFYYNANRTMTVTIDEEFFNYVQEYDPTQAILRITSDTGTDITVHPGDFSEESTNHWVYRYSFTSDADWVVSDIVTSDLIGRVGQASGSSFTIDKTAPSMQVTFDNNNVSNGKYYNAARTATITIVEHNFSDALVTVTPTSSDVNGESATAAQVSGWSRSGDVNTCTVYFAGPGAYTLAVEGMDLAENALAPYSCPEFIVDTTKPEVNISVSSTDNAEGQSGAYAGDIPASASAHDTNLDGSATSIEVTKISWPADTPNPYSAGPSITATDATASWASPDAERGYDGVYTITVQAVDLAGNTESKAATFSVNRFGSTYVISDATGEMIEAEYLQSENLADVVVTEINPSGLKSETTKSGDTVLATAVELTRDTENTTLDNGQDYSVDTNARGQDASGWSEYTYTVGRANYENQDGVYRVLFHSTDQAQNVSENTMAGKNAEDFESAAEVNFAVDDTAPIASFIDLEGGATYQEDGHSAQVSFEDNLKLASATIKVNGQAYAELDADELAASSLQPIELAESTERQTVSVTVRDAAGNVSEELLAKDVLVTTDPFTLWINNTPLFVGSLVGAAAVVGGGIWLVAAKRKRDDGEEAQA